MSVRWGGRDLALVEAGILVGQFADSQLPKMCHRHVVRRKALVGSVRVPSDCQQVDVAMPDPRDLQKCVLIERVSTYLSID